MKRISLVIVLVLLLGTSIMIGTNMGSNEATDEKIIVGMSGGYKPYTYTDTDGDLVGFEVDTWREIGKRIGRDVEFTTADFSGLFGLLDSKKIHTISNQITVNDKRKEKYIFSEPYVYYGAQLVVKEGNNEIVDLETLKGKSVGVSLGSNYEEMIREFDVNNDIEIITYESYQGSLQDVSLGRIDAVLNDKLAGLTAIEESGLNIKLAGEPIEILFNAFPFVQDQDQDLIDQVNQAIEAMYADGTFEEIALRWFPVNITEK